MKNAYFFDHLSCVAELYSTIYDKLIIMGDFNMEPSDEVLEKLCETST